MKLRIKPSVVALCAAISVAGFVSPTFAQLAQAIQAGQAGTNAAAQAQQQIDSLDDARSSAIRDYRTQLQKLDSARLFVAQQGRVVESQRTELAALEDQLGRIDEIRAEMVPMMLEMIEVLKNFVANDLPFQLNGETGRLARLARLDEYMADPNISPAERYRQIVEAFQQEMNYGRTIATYDDEVEINGETKSVTVFRYGRVSMVAQTKDANQSQPKLYVFDRTDRTWKNLPGSYRGDVRQGIRIAREVTTPSVIFGPVQRYTAGGAAQ
ncbi:MAG TPA: hypothetical protein DCZ49_01365 [Hyphomonadaceae bacterium]|nr:hypothetical protein [Hyphomonadaceae bacterium]